MNIKKNIYLVLGFIFFGIGLFGYYMPLIPGTIFMIISAYCFMNSSEKLYNKIINHPLYGNPIKQYIDYNVIPLKTKIIILISMWGATFISFYLLWYTQSPLPIKMLGIVLSIIGTVVVLKTKNNY